MIWLLACTNDPPAIGTPDDTDVETDTDPGCDVLDPAQIVVTPIDFVDREPLGAGIEVLAFENNRPDGLADATGITTQSGIAAFDLPTCTPVAFKVEAVETESRETTFPNRVYPAGSVATDDLPVVSETTARLVPTLLGVAVAPDTGSLVGTVRDAAGAPVEGATITVTDTDGAEVGIVHYSVDEFPNRDQAATSADGMFIVVDLPPGELAADVSGGGRILFGTAADRWTVADIEVGVGTPVPDVCACAFD